MMSSCNRVALFLALLFVGPHMAGAQDLAAQLNGVWKLSSLVQRELASGATATPSGARPGGTAVFAKGHFVWGWVAEGRQAPAAPVATQAESANLFATLAFGSGTYHVEGNTVVLRYDVAWAPSWTGAERRAEMQVSGNTLTWRSPTLKNADGKDVFNTLTFQRVE